MNNTMATAYRSILGVLLVLGVATGYALPVYGAVLRGGDTYELQEDSVLEDDVYLGGRDLSLLGTTTGDIYAAGSSVTVHGAVTQDVLLVGGTVLLDGPVSGDARVIGGEVYLDGSVAEDAVLVGGNVVLGENTQIQQDLIVFADRLVVAGVIQGNIEVYARSVEIVGRIEGNATLSLQESLAIKEGARIGGDVTYHAPRAAFITDDASIGGSVYFERIESSTPSNRETGIIGFLARFFVVFVGAALLLILAPRFAYFATKTAVTRSSAAFIWGFIFIILTPVVAVLLLVSIVGILPSLILLGVYGTSLVLAKLLAVIFAGALLAHWFTKEEQLKITWTALGAAVLLAVTYVPFLGWLANTLLFILGFGAIAVGLYENVWGMRGRTHNADDTQESTTEERGEEQSDEKEKSTSE